MFVIVTYDCDSKRVNKALKICRKYLTRVQNSVFEGEITEKNLEQLKKELQDCMVKSEDTFLVYSFQSKKYSNREQYGKEKNTQSIFFY